MSIERVIPIFPLNVVLFPEMILPLHIYEERYRIMIGNCLKGSGEFGVVYYDGTEIRKVGCTASITRVLNHYDDGRMDILTTGSWRFHIEELIESRPYMEARVMVLNDREGGSVKELIDLAREGIRQLEELQRFVGSQIDLGSLSRMELDDFSFILASNDLLTAEDKQRFLEMTSTGDRIRESTASLRNIIWRLRMKAELRRTFSTRESAAGDTRH